MSTAVDNTRQRPNLWSYISSYSSPRRRSVSLPARNNGDPFEKADRHSTSQRSRSTVDDIKTAWMAQTPRTRAVRTGAVIAFVIFLFFMLVPGERHRVEDFVKDHSHSNQAKPANGEKCTKSYSSDKPLKQYALMIDAGSTGSRIHVYRFNNCGPTPELENEVFKMTEKKKGGAGLSAYGDDPQGAANSLDPLMEEAMRSVPDEYKSCSPVAVKATAGLRLLGEEKSAKILDAVRSHLENDYPFPVISKEKDGVIIMDGKDEGVYAWITTNYLLGKIGGPDKTPTAAVFDLGGGSTQIVFQPNFEQGNRGMPGKLEDGDHKYEMKFGGREFELYQHSHLGYGLMKGRETIHKTIIEAHKKANPSSNGDWTAQPIENPCLIPNTTQDVKVTLDDMPEVSVKMVGPAVGAPAQCRGIAEKTLKKDSDCKLAPCSFNGIHQPSLDKTFAVEDVYIFSYFYDRLAPLGMPESFTLRELHDLTARVCEGRDGWGTFEGFEGALEELEGRPEHCLDLNFMMALLHTGYEMPLDREVKIAKKIKGNELGWCLGASLPLLEKESGWACKIKKVA